MELTMQAKKALTLEVSKRYQKAGKKEKTLILDELVKNTGYNRKYALHKLANIGKVTTVRFDGKMIKLKAVAGKRRKGGGRKPIYTGEFAASLRQIRAFFWFRRGKILAPFMKERMPFLELRFPVSAELKEPPLRVSPSTVDRCLRAEKKKPAPKGKSGTKPGPLLKKQVPARTYYTNEEKKPGFFEVDTVHHCGTPESGECGL
jgi:hypothetical protein